MKNIDKELFKQICVLPKCAGIDLMFDTFDNLHSEGKFEESDKLLASVDFNQEGMTTTIVTGLMTITAAAATHLPSRQETYNRAIAWMIRECGEERANKIFKNI